jgi:glycosyltransferase involved in cell wall biosynthesis
MKIGIYDPYLDTLSGGEKYILSMATCLMPENDVFIFWDKNKEDDFKKLALNKLGLDLSSIKFFKNIFDSKVSFGARYMESRQFDAIIYLSDGSIPLVGTKLFIHFQFPTEWINGDSIKNKIKLLFTKDIICNSRFTKNFIDRKLNVKSKVLYPPVDLRINRDIKKENIILHVGRFATDSAGSNYKKQDVMIKTFKNMVGSGLSNWKMVVIIGVKKEDENMTNKLKVSAKDYPIEIIENPSNEILWKYYSKAKIYWHATGFGENLEKFPEKAEHFGISTVEAMGAGAVPVVINAGGQKEIVENNRSGYLWNTLEELISKTNNLIEDERKWKMMSARAVERSKIFCGDRFCIDLKNIIK